jgi:1-acyl-sn-glycerol-3-phosphate acyltransferase
MGRRRRADRNRWWSLARWTLGPLIQLALRIRFVGAEYIPQQGPAVLAANHRSPLDPIVLGLAAYERGRVLRFLAAAELFERPVLAWALRALGQVPLRRGARDRAALARAVEVLREGGLVGVFPEGRMGEGGQVLPGRTGVARIASGRAPIVPVGLWGTQYRWPRTGPQWGRPLRPTVAVVFGPPIDTGAIRGEGQTRMLIDRLMAEIAGLMKEARRLAR